MAELEGVSAHLCRSLYELKKIVPSSVNSPEPDNRSAPPTPFPSAPRPVNLSQKEAETGQKNKTARSTD